MAIFGPKPWVNPLGKMSIFRLFWTSCFYSLERRFFVLEYHKRHFPGVYCLKKKVGKMAILDQNLGLNPFGKMSIFCVFELLVFIAQKGVVLFQNIVKDIILAYIAYMAYIALKKKVGKMAIFGRKPWVNPFGKMSIFRLFEFLVFVAQKGVVSFQNVVNDSFLAYISL